MRDGSLLTGRLAKVSQRRRGVASNDATLPEAHTNAGIAYYKLGNQAAAIDEWKRSLALRPDEKVRNLLSKVTGTQ